MTLDAIVSDRYVDGAGDLTGDIRCGSLCATQLFNLAEMAIVLESQHPQRKVRMGRAQTCEFLSTEVPANRNSHGLGRPRYT